MQFFDTSQKNNDSYVVTSADGVLCTENAWNRGWESYITALETELNGCHKRWYHLTHDWIESHPDEYAQYEKLKKKYSETGAG